MSNDSGAREPLLAAMAAAGRHDLLGVLEALAAAEEAIGPRQHKAHDDITLARSAAHGSNWVAVWAKAHHGLCDLTWSFPPDVSTCPPMPGPDPILETATCCGEVLSWTARFCPMCGSRVGN
jgi:hypothetical protein